MIRGFAGLLIVLGLAVLQWSCASLGTEAKICTPELVNTIRVVGLAPIYVDDLTLSVCGEAESLALAALVSQIEQSGAFKAVSADALMANIQEKGGVDAEALLASARRLNLDGVLFCKLGAYEVETTTTETVGYGVSFGAGGTHLHTVQEDVTKVNWGGAKVSLQIVDSSAGKIVIMTTFNTLWGKSYGFTPPPNKQIADAMEGAFKPLAKVWVK